MILWCGYDIDRRRIGRTEIKIGIIMSPRITATLVLAITFSAVAVMSPLSLFPIALTTVFAVIASLLSTITALAVPARAPFAMRLTS